jgi:hypothetical protein|tara:strand:- start:56 stop:367 length:312 start_codon:yes stop_codon:yes gene_type:complete
MPMMMSVLAVKDKRMRVYNDETFLVFHNEHPEIYEGFRKYAMKALAIRNRWSARAIFHLLRWDTLLDSGGEYKICDGWSPYYAKKFMAESPKHEGFFRTRNMT